MAHFSRMLRRGWPGYLRLVAGMTGASVAGVVFGSAAIALHPEPVPSELIWAIGGAVGWLGGDVMDTIARFFLRKMGVEEREKP
ncbi:MAG: hypothetical protein NZ821_08855 [Gloeomargarita sp. SKYB31]|nr:hypothetical protein [Gloeomargarita sp. SKYB31]